MEIETSPDKKENQIIVKRLFESGYDAKGIMELGIVGLVRSTVYKQIEKLKLGKDIGYKGGPGNQKKLDDENVLAILDYITDKPEASCSDISAYLLKELDLDVSPETVRRMLQELGLTYKDPKLTFFLTDYHKEFRVSWAQEHLQKDWRKVVFSDETTFWLGRSGVARWKSQGEENIHMVSKNVPKINVWGAISWNGKISLTLFRENLTSLFYVEILESKLNEMRRLQCVSGWSYQQDNDPKHTAKITQEWFKKNKVKTLSWPASSPDLNPIENVWGIMKKEIGKMKPKNLEELETCLIELWESIPLETIRSLVESMGRRCIKVIEKSGERISY